MKIQGLVRGLAAALAIASLNAAGQQAGTLPPSVTGALRGAGIPPGSVAVAVQALDAPRPLLAVNADTPMNPASTMKLVTTFAGLELLGPAYRWRTDAFITAPINEGALTGDLVLKGRGDPKLALEDVWRLMRELRARGLREIRGNLVLDRSYFATGPYDPAAFDGDGLAPYNVGADALLLNFKAVRLQFLPDPVHGTVRVVAEPKVLDLVNVLRLASGACGDWREKVHADFQTQASPVRALFTGTYPAACGEQDWHVAPLQADAYADGLFRQLWGELGGTLAGVTRDGPVPPQATALATLESPTLAEIVRDINKFSNNVMARQLYLTIAAVQSGEPGTEAKARAAIRAWLAGRGLDFPELVMENGAGLSRVDRISARSLSTLLVAAYRSAVMPELMASLPLVAVDGTMRKRLKGGGVAGHAHIKTGSLSDARAIAGYVLARDGRRYAVTMLVNHPNAGLARPAQDALLNWVYGQTGRGLDSTSASQPRMTR